MKPKGDILKSNGEDVTRESTLAYWKSAGVVATVVVIFSLPLYLIRERNLSDSSARTAGKPAAAFVGSAKCQSCHKPEYDKWRGSHHDRAMAEAKADTVLGDFDDVTFDYYGDLDRTLDEIRRAQREYFDTRDKYLRAMRSR